MRQQFKSVSRNWVSSRSIASKDWLIDWRLTAPQHMQKGQFVPSTGAGKQLCRLRMANDTMNEWMKVTRRQCNTVHSTVIHSSNTNATTSSLIAWLTCLTCHLAGKPVNILMYANDLVLLAPSWYAQQSLLSTCARAVTDLHISFKTSKSYTLIFEPYRSSQRIFCSFPSFTLMSSQLKVVDNFKISRALDIFKVWR